MRSGLWTKKEQMTELWSWVASHGPRKLCAFWLCHSHGGQAGKEETDSCGSTSASFHYSEFVGSHPGQVPQFPAPPPTLPIISFLLHRLSYLLSGFKAVATALETLSRITPPDPGYLLSCPTLYRMFWALQNTLCFLRSFMHSSPWQIFMGPLLKEARC